MVMEVTQKFTLVKHKYAISGSGWTISGNPASHEYTIGSSYGKVTVVCISDFAGSNCIDLDLSNTVNETMVIRALATILAIDCVTAKKIPKNRSGKKK